MEWISVDERLPNSIGILLGKVRVLIAGNKPEWQRIKEVYYDDVEKTFCCWHNPTHWQPIKKPQGQ